MSATSVSHLAWYSHPFVIAILQSQATSITAGFTSSHSMWRPAVLMCMLMCSAYSIYRFPTYITTTAWPARVLGGMPLGVPIHFFDRLILRRWAFGDGQPGPNGAVKRQLERKRKKLDGVTGEHLNESTFSARMAFGQEVSGSVRDIGEPWEVKNVPPFSARDPNWVPSQFNFIVRKSLSVLFCYYTQVLTIDAIVKYNDHVLLSDSRIPFLSRLRNVSAQEICFRVVIVFMHWLWQYCYMQGFYALFSIISVASDASKIPLWRPFFGGPAHSYTLRNFWGKSWHQAVRSDLEGPSRFITFTILHLPKGTLIARYSNIFWAFFISGVLHWNCDRVGAINLEKSGAIRFFYTQPLGIVIEDGVQELYRRARGKTAPETPTPMWVKLVGYLWVIVFLAWSTPSWAYPVLRTMTKEEAPITFGACHSILPFR